jgi:hypothetical protein
LLLIPVSASFLAWFWIGNMSLLQGPQSWLGLLSALTVLSTAAIAATEGSKVGMRRSRNAGTESPLGWFIGISLLWVVGYPMYLRKRRLFGLKDRCFVGTLIALVFLGTVAVLEWSIQSAVNDFQATLHGVEGSRSESDRGAEVSTTEKEELNKAMLAVRPGIADLGGTTVSNFLGCLEKAPKPFHVV